MQDELLIIEDDEGVRTYLKELLLDNGFLTYAAESGIEGLTLMEKYSPKLVILDLGLPDLSGESVCVEINRRFPEVKIIILSAKHTTTQVIHGLNLGADDYIIKPFNSDEFLARVSARLRDNKKRDSFLRIGNLEINTDTHEVKRAQHSIELSATEYLLLCYMVINQGHILTRDMILARIWANSPGVETRIVDVYVGYLRKKIDFKGEKPLIHSVRGFGYLVKQ